jgi:putative sterol carrier protein
MAGDPIKQFFEELSARGHERSLESVTGSVRIDVVDGRHTEHWYIQISKGDVSVSHKNAKADAVVRVERKVLEGSIAGTVNTMAAFLRGLIGVEGDFGLVILFDRLLPGPPDSTGRVAPIPARRA